MAEYLVKTNQTGKSQGPFSGRQMKKLAASGRLRPTHLISLNGGESWHKAKKFSKLKFGVMEADAGSNERSGPTSTTSAVPVVDQPPLVFAESHWEKCFAFNPIGDRLAIGGEGTVTLWDIPAKSVNRVIRGKRDAGVESLAFSASGQQLVVCFKDDYKARVFDVATGERTHLLDGGENEFSVFGLVASDDSLVATNGWRGTVDRWDLESGEKLSSIVAYAASTTEVQSLAVTSDGAFVVTCRDDDEDLRIFSFKTSQRIGICWGHESAVKAVAASPLPNVVASGDETGTIVLWDIPAGKAIRKLDTELNSVADLVFSPCGSQLLATGYTNCVLVLNVDDLSTLRRLELEEDPDHLVLSADGSLLACDATSEGVVLWHLGSPHDSLDEMVQISGGAMADGEFDADNESTEGESDSCDDEDSDDKNSDDEEHWDEDDDAIDGEEEIEGVFDPDGWSLATEGEIEWSVLLEAVGTPRESSLATTDEWRAAQSENRVLTIAHTGDGMQYSGRVGLTGGMNYCRVVVSQSMPDDLHVLDVDVTEIDCDFYASAQETENATEALMQACQDGDLESARQAISSGADCTHTNWENQMTPMLHAIAGGHLGIVSLLTETGIDPDSQSGAWRTAIAAGHPKLAEHLAEQGFEKEPNEAMLESCHAGQSDAVRDMLELIEDVNESATVWGRKTLQGTPLTVAAAAGQAAVVSLLLKAGASSTTVDSEKISPWVAAAAGGHDETCELLESHGAETDVQSALVVAAQRGQIEVVSSLLDRGADVNGQVNLATDGITVLEAVLASQEIEVVDDSEDKSAAAEEIRGRLFELALERGGNPNLVTSDGSPLLHVAVRQNRESCLTALLIAGADLEATDGDGETALIRAVSQNSEDMLSRLLFRGANPDATDSKGVPALMLMFDEYSQCNVAIAKWLIAYGVALDVTDAKGRVFEQLCEYEVMKNSADSDDDEDVDSYSGDQATEILTVIRDQELLNRVHSLLARATDQNFMERLECAVDFFEDNSLAYSLVRERVSQLPGEAKGLLVQLLEHDDWRYRCAAALSLPELKLASEEVLPLMLDNLADSDEDVRQAIWQAIVALGPEVVDLLISAMADRPTEMLQSLWWLVSAIDPERAPDVRQALNKMLPADPASTRGLDRLRAGVVLGMLGAFHANEEATTAALECYQQSLALNPDLYTGFWMDLASLKSQQGDDTLERAINCYQQAVEANSIDELQRGYEEAMKLAPDFPWSFNNLAWFLATTSEPSARNGQRAVEVATRVCEHYDWHYHSFNDTLAAAYAEAGNFEKAIELVQKAIECSPAGFQPEYQENLQRYQRGEGFDVDPHVPNVSCPVCEWKPTRSSVWVCNCEHNWNTFDTRGECPECSTVYDTTTCLVCGDSSPHEEWYG